NREIPRGGTWVITGGARGITSIAAKELARRYGWKLHLIGKSPAPQQDAEWRGYNEAELKAFVTKIARQAVAEGRSPSTASDRVTKDVEIFNNLREFAEAGVCATYHSCDIGDRAALAAALEEVRRQDGPIQGIIHGAGTIDPGRFESKRRDFLNSQIGAKISGALNLMALTERDPLAFFIGFGSISGRFGGNGLSDYAAGNDGLAKLIDWYRAARPDCASCCIHWESWEGSGMATQPRFAWGPKSVMNMKYMLPEEGVRRLEQELEAGFPDSEVLYTFGDFYPMFYSREQRPLGPFSPGAPEQQDLPAKDAASPIEWPLLSNIRRGEQEAEGDAPLDPLNDSFLIQHRLRDKPLLPVVVGMEVLAEAASVASGQSVVGFDNVQMLDGLLFHTDRAITAQTRALANPDGSYACELTSDFLNRSGGLIQKARPYLRAVAQVGERNARVVESFSEAPSHFTDVAYSEDAPIYHGPVFRCMNGVQCDREGGWGRLVARPLADLTGAERAAEWTIPSAVLDSAFFSCGVHLFLHAGGAISLPKGIDRLRLGRAARDGETCLVHFTCRELSVDSACYDFTLMGEDGQLIAEATGYRKVILSRGGPQ
ncbi:MAG TPA: KR domain-containing protein, partial [Pirellulales bacterium]